MSDKNLKTITPNPPADFTPEMGNYKTLQPFRYWCQKVLPLVYDDSLSYYELLCKVVDYLNKTMEDVETLHGDVENLYTAFEQLQSYVNNYFANLDVQEEINNKLDDMAENGTLGAIISKITQSYAINVVFSGVKNDGTNVTTELQNLINNNPYGVLYFPAGNYTFYDIDGKNCSLIFSPNAVIIGDSTSDKWFFNYVDATHVTINGGIFKRGTENSRDLMPQVNGRKTGVFRFENCEQIEIKNIHVAYNTGNDMVALLSCKNVIIENCCFNWMLDAGVHVYDSCNGVAIRNCRFTNAILPNDRTRWYVYTINVGLSSFSYAGEANKNVTIENCFFENCEWEGIDSHGCTNLFIRNNIIHNAPRFIMAYGDDRNLTPRQYSNIIIENNYCYNDDNYTPNIIRGEEDTFFGISVASFGQSKQSNIIIANNRLVNTYLSSQSDASFIRTNNTKNVAVFNNRIEKRIGSKNKNIIQHFLYTTDINVFNNTIMLADCDTAYMGFYSCTGSVHDNHFICKSYTPDNVVYFGEDCFMSRSKNVGACSQSTYNDRVNNIVYKGEAVLSESDNLPNGAYYEQDFTTGIAVTISGNCTAGNQYFTTDKYYVTPALFGTLVITDEAGHEHSIECVVTWFEDSKVYINASIPANGTCVFTSFTRTTKRRLLENNPSQYNRTIAELKATSDVEIRQVKIIDPSSNINGGVYQFINTLDFFTLLNPGRIYVYTRASNKWYGIELTERDIH